MSVVQVMVAPVLVMLPATMAEITGVGGAEVVALTVEEENALILPAAS